MYNMLSVYDDTSKFLGTGADETMDILSLPCPTYFILLAKSPSDRGGTAGVPCTDDMRVG